MRTLSVILPGLVLLAMLRAEPQRGSPIMANEQAQMPKKIVLVIHGGAGVLSDAEMKEAGVTAAEYERDLARALHAGYSALQTKGKTSVDAVEAAIRVMEDSELFNAGRGAVFTSDGRVECDASIMEGTMVGSGEGKRDPRKRAGAITGVTHIRNPISAARAVMEMDGSRHVMFHGEGAEAFALTEANRAKYKIERVSNLYFWTDHRVKQIREIYAKREKKETAMLESADARFGTVGAVALDQHNMIAAGTSTGGVTNKMPGRVGDSPIIGAGTYADDRACGVSCTGTGEVFIRHATAHSIVARMLYAKSNVTDAVKATLDEMPDDAGGVGGLIALDRDGHHVFGMSKKCDGMYRGYVTEDGEIYVAIFANDAMKRMKPEAAK